MIIAVPNEGIVQGVFGSVASIVRKTFGPNGDFVAITNGSGTAVTKDGVSVVRVIHSDDIFEQAIIDVIREASLNTLKEAGDGTTSTILLAYEIFSRFNKKDFRNKDKIIAQIVENIRMSASNIKLTDRVKRKVVSGASSGDNELTDAILDAFAEAERLGVGGIFAEPVIGGKTGHVSIDGISIKATMIDTMFFDDASTLKKDIEEPHFIVHSSEVVGEEDVLSAITVCADNGIKDIVFFAPKFSISALSALAVNHRVSANITPMVIDGGNERWTRMSLEAIAASVGAKMLGENEGVSLEDITMKHIGKADSMSAKDYNVLITGGNRNDSAASQLSERYSMAAKKAETDEDKDKYRVLMSILAGKLVKVIVGGESLASVTERKDRADDAINALELAIEGGVVPGSCTVYQSATSNLGTHTDFYAAATSLREALGSMDGHTDVYDPAGVAESVVKQAIEMAFTLGRTAAIVSTKKS